MKTFTKALALIVSITFSAVTYGDAGACYSIQDSDQRNYCIAQAKRDSGACYSIRDADQKNYCLATIRKDSGQCYSIRDQNLRNQCRALTQ